MPLGAPVRRATAAAAAALLAATALLAAAGPAAADPDFALQRIDGTALESPDRYGTAAQVAIVDYVEEGDGASRVLLAQGGAPTDALAASYLAGALDAPLLLTTTGALPAATKEALSLLGATRVTIIGGTAAVSPQVEAELKALVPTVDRISGPDRYATGRAVVLAAANPELPVGEVDGTSAVLLVTGEDFPDALSAGPLAAGARLPLLLTRRDVLPDATRTTMQDIGLQGGRVVIVGGTAAVSPAVAAEVQALTGTAPVRLAGDSRYETSRLVADFAYDRLGANTQRVVLARGDSFADALAGGPHGGRVGGPLLLVQPTSLPAPATLLLQQRCFDLLAGDVLGGIGAVSPGTVVGATFTVTEECTAPSVSATSATTTFVRLTYSRPLDCSTVDAGGLDYYLDVVGGTLVLPDSFDASCSGSVVTLSRTGGTLLSPGDDVYVRRLPGSTLRGADGRYVPKDEVAYAVVPAA